MEFVIAGLALFIVILLFSVQSRLDKLINVHHNHSIDLIHNTGLIHDTTRSYIELLLDIKSHTENIENFLYEKDRIAKIDKTPEKLLGLLEDMQYRICDLDSLPKIEDHLSSIKINTGSGSY